jgi:predicted HAD superfamily Cof-like phosphohydrolase
MEGDLYRPRKAGLDEAWEKVRDFQLLIGTPISPSPACLRNIRKETWRSWMAEELNEFSSASTAVAQADAAMDLIYFALGALVEMGIPPQEIFMAVHNSNLAKVMPDGTLKCEANGKVIKPDGWISPEREIEIYIDQLSRQVASDEKSS